MSNEVLRIVTHVLPVAFVEYDFSVTALVDQILQVLATERRVSAKQRIGDDAKRPHIDRLRVAFLQHDFRGSITE